MKNAAAVVLANATGEVLAYTGAARRAPAPGGELDLYQVNLGLRQVTLEAHLSDGGLDFSGNARAGNGNAAIFRSMPANSRRVRRLSASRSQ